MSEMAPAGNSRVESVGGRSALERLLFGPLPVALILVESLAVQTRRGSDQVAAAACQKACHGVPTRLWILEGATAILALSISFLVSRYWRQHAGARRPWRTIAMAALAVFAGTAAITPWTSFGAPLSLAALVVAVVSYQAAAGGVDELSFPGVVRLHGVRVAVVVIVIYALFLLVVPQSSPQAIDAMLAWTSHPSYVFVAVASAALLALVVHDSALLLVHRAQRVEGALAGGLERNLLHAAGLAVIAALAVLALLSYVAWYGVVFPALLFALLAVTNFVKSAQPMAERPEAGVRRQVAAWLRLVAEIPLVLFTAAVALAFVEAVLGGDAWGIFWLAAAVVLLVGGLALLERGEQDDPYDAEKPPPFFDRPALLQTQWWAAVFASVAASDWHSGDLYGIGIAGVALFVGMALLAVHLWMRRGWPESVVRTRSWLTLRYLGLVPLAALPVGELAGWPGAGLLVSYAVIAAAIAYWLAGQGPRAAWKELMVATRGRGLGLPIARGAGIAVLLGALLNVERTASIVGTIAVVNIAAAAAIAILHSLVARFDSWRIPAKRTSSTLRIAGKRVPILSIFAAWFVVTLIFAPGASHRMPVMARTATPPPTIDDAVTSFMGRPADLPSAKLRPILLVASDGGGARASYWTALMLDCMVAARPPHKAPTGTACSNGRDGSIKAQIVRARTILLASGVSGGGVGLAQYAAALAGGGNHGLPRDWAENVAGYDMLRAPTTWGVTHDIMAGLLGVHAPDEQCLRVDDAGRRVDDGLECRLTAALTRDRGNVLAESIGGAGGREQLPQVSLRSVVPTTTNSLPAFIDNATLAGGVARVIVSPLELAPHLTNNAEARQICGTMRRDPTCRVPPVTRARDLVDVLGAGRDMPLLAAATLGARFPIITAPGYVASCGNPGTMDSPPESRCDEPSSSMSDGGFLENTGLLTIREMLPLISQRIAEENAKIAEQNAEIPAENAEDRAAPYALYVVELDNHARKATDTGEIKSARVATTVLNLTSARDFIEGYARESVINYVGSDCYLRVHPTASAAGSAPTGWLLSDDAESGLAQSLQSPSPTYKTVQTLVQWIDGTHEDGACVP
jgi:hypothetical protein